MRARTAVTAAALAMASALILTACGGGSGGDDKITSSPNTTTTSASPSASAPSAGGNGVRIDPAFKLPADLNMVFQWTAPADRTQAVVLNATANFMQSMAYGVVKQNATSSGLGTYATGPAYTYAKQYVQNHVAAKKTLTGTDLFLRPVVKLEAKNTAAEVTLCESQAKLYSKEIATGKVHYTTPSDEDFTSYQIVLVKAPTKAEWWQAQSVNYKERAVECKP